MERTYNQFCATARTLDLVGERWTLLIVRELLTGPKRFSDFQGSLRGLGTGLLAARLKHLEREGVVRKIILPPPARTPAYALTEAGAELAPAVMALARWGAKWAMGERRPEDSFHPGWAVLALRAFFDPEAARGLRAVYEFRVGEDVFHALVEDGTIDTRHGPAQRPDAVIETDEDVLVEMGEGRTSLATALRENRALASGDPSALGRLHSLFRMPRPMERT